MKIEEDAMPSTNPLTITPLSAHTGVEVTGVDLSKPVDEETRARLNKAFVDHSVLVVRDQASLTKSAMTFFWPALSNVMSSLLPSMDLTMP